MAELMPAAQVKQAITGYYSGDTIWDDWTAQIQASGITETQIWEAINEYDNTKAIEVMKSIDGKVLGYGYAQNIQASDLNSSVNNFINTMDSNITPGEFSIDTTVQTRINPSIFKDQSTGDITMKSGAFQTNPSTGVVSTVATVADKVSLGVVGVNLGAKLGRFIDETIYKTDPDFWDSHFPEINPETWDSLATTQGGKSFVRSLFGIQGNTATMYVDEDVLAYTYQLLRDMGLLDDTIHIEPQQITEGTIEPKWIGGSMTEMCNKIFGLPAPVGTEDYTVYLGNSDNETTLFYPFGGVYDEIDVTSTSIEGLYEANRTIQGYAIGYTKRYNQSTGRYEVQFTVSVTGISQISTDPSIPGTYLTVGNLIGKEATPIPDSTQYPPDNITGTTPQQVKQQLKQNYPQLFDNSITETVLQPDGTITEHTYVPMPWVVETTDPNPDIELQTIPNPTTDPNTTADDQTNPHVPDTTLPQIVQRPTNPPPSNTAPDTGTGDTPSIVTPTGSASSLWAVYNPTQAEVDAFGAWLWTSDLVEQIKKLFIDPMQAIIGIHKVFVTPDTGSSVNIKCGYITSTVTAKSVTSQYKTVDCGTISLPEYFGNVYDYEPFTTVKCFLPFIGIVPLNVSNIMRSKINIKYHVDVITGACLAEIKVTRDGCKTVLYTYSGSAIVSYPISSGSYAGVISSVVQTAMGIALGSPVTVASGILSAHADTSVNGSFSGCAGAMGCKKPYLIISRPQTRFADNANNFIGIGANYTTTIEYCKGFFKVKEIHLHIEGAYDSEINEITALLKQGVLTDSDDTGYYYESQVSDIAPITITENGRYTADGIIRGYNPINVNIAPPPAPVLIEKSIDENGVYNASDDDADGFSKVVVNVSSGGGIPLLSRSVWDALTTLEKQAYQLVAIQDYSTGFERGVLVYGADYLPPSEYIPNSNVTHIICEAYYENFDINSNTWGNGTNPIQLMTGLNPTQNTTDESIVMNVQSNNAVPYVDLGASDTPFTAYVVMKLINPSAFSRCICTLDSLSAGQGILLYGSTIAVSSWANDTSTGFASNVFFVGCIQFASPSNALGKVNTGNIITKPPTHAGRYISIARSNIDIQSAGNQEPCNCEVKYLGVVNEAESQTIVNQNVQALYTKFISP